MALVKTSFDHTKGEDHNDGKVENAISKQEERVNTMAKAIDELDLEKDYTKGPNSKPQVEALEIVTGFKEITGKERDDAFEIYNG